VWFRLLFVPDVLLSDYGPGVLWPAMGPNGAGVLGLVIALTLVTIGVLAILSGRMLLAMGALWFPITILPVSNLLLPIGVLVAERTLYVPSVALSFLVCAAAAAVAQTGSGTRRVAAAAFAIVLALFGVRTALRAPVWDSTDSVMIALVEDRPDAFRGRWHMARMARNAGQMVHAMNEYDAAIAIWPRRQSLILEATAFAAEQQRVGRAFELAQLAASQWPDDVAVQRVLAGTALDAGQFGVAREAIRAGLALEPDDAMLLRMAAFVDSVGGGAS
jgi:tetratricopeptide (TPR) repeat protein